MTYIPEPRCSAAAHVTVLMSGGSSTAQGTADMPDTDLAQEGSANDYDEQDGCDLLAPATQNLVASMDFKGVAAHPNSETTGGQNSKLEACRSTVCNDLEDASTSCSLVERERYSEDSMDSDATVTWEDVRALLIASATEMLGAAREREASLVKDAAMASAFPIAVRPADERKETEAAPLARSITNPSYMGPTMISNRTSRLKCQADVYDASSILAPETETSSKFDVTKIETMSGTPSSQLDATQCCDQVTVTSAKDSFSHVGLEQGAELCMDTSCCDEVQESTESESHEGMHCNQRETSAPSSSPTYTDELPCTMDLASLTQDFISHHMEEVPVEVDPLHTDSSSRAFKDNSLLKYSPQLPGVLQDNSGSEDGSAKMFGDDPTKTLEQTWPHTEHGHYMPNEELPQQKCSPQLPGVLQDNSSSEAGSAKIFGDEPTKIVEQTWPHTEHGHYTPNEELSQLVMQASQAVQVFCGFWNLNGKQAPADISSWIPRWPRHHLYVIGTCECERSILKSLVWPCKKRWEKQVQAYLGKDYMMIKTQSLNAMHLMVFAHRSLWRYIWDIKAGCVATGVGNFLGNKGSTQVGFKIGHTALLFVNAHLAAHTKNMTQRTRDLERILTRSPLRTMKGQTGVHEEYNRVFLMGDLNSRVEASRADVNEWLSAGSFDECLRRDQLSALRHKSASGVWSIFQEAAISFPPTYKFDAGSDVYDSKRQRVPSWTDRVLWKHDTHIRALTYNSVQALKCSDHRPIFSHFEVIVNLADWQGPEQSVSDEKSSV